MELFWQTIAVHIPISFISNKAQIFSEPEDKVVEAFVNRFIYIEADEPVDLSHLATSKFSVTD